MWTGDPGQADPNLIPGAFGLDDPQWVMKESSLDYAADYQLIHDNLPYQFVEGIRVRQELRRERVEIECRTVGSLVVHAGPAWSNQCTGAGSIERWFCWMNGMRRCDETCRYRQDTCKPSPQTAFQAERVHLP